MNRIVGATFVTLVAVLLASPAAAQESDEDLARMHFRVGRAYYDSGRFEEAAREFEEAYAQSGRAALLYNLYVSYRDAGQPAEAADRLRRYLADADEIENRAQLEARLVSMERMAASADSGGEEGEAVGDDDDPGGGQPSAPVTRDTPPSSEGGGGGTWTPGWIILGGGAALVVAGVLTSVLALDAQTQLTEQFGCRPDGACAPGFEDTRDSGALFAGLTDGFLFGGGAIAVVGVVLALVLADGDEDARATLTCGAEGCAAGVRGRF